MIFLVLFIFILISIVASILGFTNFYKKIKYNKKVQNENNILKRENEYLKAEQEFEQEKLSFVKNKLEELKKIQKDYEINAQQSFSNYCEILDNDYNKKEEEYRILEKKLQDNYTMLQEHNLKVLNIIKDDLEKMRQTRIAAIDAERKEKEIEENLSFYCIQPTEDELHDIQVLNRIKSNLHQPRILCMLIWSTYYQKPMTSLCNNVLGTSTVSGVYKITNQITKQCYIGQAVDVAARWKQHAKCGLGIDTPTTNKLYKAMLEDGLHNFSFELLEECKKEELNEKETFFIELYNSCSYGYNSNKRNKITYFILFKNYIIIKM